ncbi:MAG: DUF4388 domain-containing protein [Planctomycetes bacterium]|nr:DUF4388 domain-containing protein [Planctomycetota bacterium]
MSAANSSVAGLVDLPELVQTISMQRRTGTMVVQGRNQVRRVYFNNGAIIALTGAPSVWIAKALVWADIIKPARMNELMRELGSPFTELALLEKAQAKGLADKNALLDVMDCYVEENFTEMVSWSSPELQFVPNLAADQWAAFQAKLGVNVQAGSILLEAMRRQDELKSMAAHLPDPADILIRDTSLQASREPSADERILLGTWKDGRTFADLRDNASMPPFRTIRALAGLCQLGTLRIGSPAELVVHADAAHSHGDHQRAYGLYRRAVDLGVESPRIHLHLAELAERLGDNAAAAKSYVIAATLLADTGSSVIALRNALRLGADKEAPLISLYGIYQQLGEKDDAISVLIELAEHFEGKKALDQAAQAVREAQELGADPAACAQVLARLAMAEGDMDQAVLQLELVARYANEKGLVDEAVGALRQLHDILPGRLDYACTYAEALATLGKQGDAHAVLRAVLTKAEGATEEVLVGVYELVARFNPSDVAAHKWLAAAYQRRKNRDGATDQLKLMAKAQEKEGDLNALASTYERILELGGEQIDVLKKLALVYSRLGMEGKASSTLSRSVDAALALGHLKEARQICEVAIEMDPGSLPLRTRLANVANREGDRSAALIHYRAAADLARATGKPDVANAALLQVRKLRPDDLVVRLELADLALELSDPEIDLTLKELVHFAVRTHNFGIALERARQRVDLAGGKLAFEARNELVELMRRMGDQANELIFGKQLLDDLLEQGEFDRAVQLLQRLVVSNPRNSDLVLQLAEVCSSLDDQTQAMRFYRHGVTLLQLENRTEEAGRMLDTLERMNEDPDAIAMARELLASGQALEWEAIRWSQEQGQRKRLADELASTSQKLPAIKS